MMALGPIGSSGRLPLLLLACLAAFLSRPASADSTISDPQAWCGALAQLVAGKEMDKAVDLIVEGSAGSLRRADVAREVAPMNALLGRVGEASSVEPLGYRHYGTRVTRAWYVVAYSRAAVFVRCQLVRAGSDTWVLSEFSFNTNPDTVGVPATP